MHTDFLGANLNLTQYVDSQASYNIEMYDDAENELRLTNCTAKFYVINTSDGTVYDGGTALKDNVLTLFFPALSAGNYRYEVALTYDDGAVRPLMGGQLLVLSTSVSNQRVTGLNPTVRTVRATVPASQAKHIELQWLVSTTAELASIMPVWAWLVMVMVEMALVWLSCSSDCRAVLFREVGVLFCIAGFGGGFAGDVEAANLLHQFVAGLGFQAHLLLQEARGFGFLPCLCRG